jgi:hypothetical protein
MPDISGITSSCLRLRDLEALRQLLFLSQTSFDRGFFVWILLFVYRTHLAPFATTDSIAWWRNNSHCEYINPNFSSCKSHSLCLSTSQISCLFHLTIKRQFDQSMSFSSLIPKLTWCFLHCMYCPTSPPTSHSHVIKHPFWSSGL